jgi:molybdate transport system substrate-binding protein
VTRGAALIALVLVIAACTSAGGATTAATTPTSQPASAPATAAPAASKPVVAVELSVYAAASLKDALAAVKAAYETAVPGVTLTVATDASSILRTQIEQGAPADVFLSADTENPDALVAGGLADGPTVAFARNRLTVIVPLDNPAAIATATDLARPGVKVVAAGDEVPITRYATQAVDQLAALAGVPAGFAKGYAANIVSKEENVKAVVGKIELGEGDAAIVYVTDAKASTKVATIDIPPDANVIASYGGVVVKASAHAAAAHSFLDWLRGPDGAAILATFGFLPSS